LPVEASTGSYSHTLKFYIPLYKWSWKEEPRRNYSQKQEAGGNPSLCIYFTLSTPVSLFEVYSFVLKWISGLRQWLGQFSVRDSLIALSLSTSPTIQSSKHNIVGHPQIPITNLAQALNA